jgi:gliding motility-associated-like protein
LRGICYSPNINYRWTLPQSLTQAGDTLKVLADFSKPTTTLLATYTLVVEDNSSTCINTRTVDILQNLFPPIARISGSGSLTCTSPSLVLSNISTWGANNPFPTPNGVSAILWEGPSPQQPMENSSTYNAFQFGTYTMTARDMNNGCVSTTVHAVVENRNYPVVNNPTIPGPFPLDCGGERAKVYPVVTSGTTGLVYVWTSPLSATTSIRKGTVDTLLTNLTGEYIVAVTNTLNGCTSTGNMEVISGSLSASFDVDEPTGFAPHTVSLENNSTSSINNASITSIWVFGNNTTATLSSVSFTNTTYTQPGTYTITLYVQKGECLESAQKVVVVDIPSQMVIPNVFTPNGDGVNDLFILQRSSNISQISAVIYDRWGNQVYGVDSSKGQIEWDGNNMFGKEVPSGTYFYIIKATGRDGEEYDEKGSISLIR